jgi:hypothetical protein
MYDPENWFYDSEHPEIGGLAKVPHVLTKMVTRRPWDAKRRISVRRSVVCGLFGFGEPRFCGA